MLQGSISGKKLKGEIKPQGLTANIIGATTVKSYNYPSPTGQTTEYATGDDAWQYFNVWKPLWDSLKGKKVITPVLVDFFTLANKNAFGNYSRFTDENGNPVDPDNPLTTNYLIDHDSGVALYKQVFDDPDGIMNFVEITNTYDIPDAGSGLVYNETDETIYVSRIKNSSPVVVYDTDFNKLAEIGSYTDLINGAWNSTENTILWCEEGNDTVRLFQGLSEINSKVVGGRPRQIAYNPTNNYFYVSCFGSNEVYVLNKDLNEIKVIPVGNAPLGLAYNLDTDKVYVACRGSDRVDVIDNNLNVVDNLPGNNSPWHVAYNSNNKLIFFTNADSQDIYVYDNNHNFVGSLGGLGGGLRYIAYNPNNNYIYASSEGANELYIINKDLELLETLITEDQPVPLAYNSKDNIMYLGCRSNKVQTIASTGTGLEENYWEYYINWAQNQQLEKYDDYYMTPANVIDKLFSNVIEPPINWLGVEPPGYIHTATTNDRDNSATIAYNVNNGSNYYQRSRVDKSTQAPFLLYRKHF